jgi:hypothetical protein
MKTTALAVTDLPPAPMIAGAIPLIDVAGHLAGEGRRPANVNRALPINFCGGLDEIVAQLQRAREQIGWGRR